MISNYIRPQLIIEQLLQVVQPVAAPTLNALIVGPQFDLSRYAVPAERARMQGTLFAANTNPANQQLIAYETLNSWDIIDQPYVQLNGENMEAQYWVAASHVYPTDSNLYDFQLLSLSNPNAILVIRRGATIQANWGNSYSGGGQIVSVTILFGGSGYAVSTTMDVPVIGGTGSGAVVRLTTNSSGVVISGVVISPGVGYLANVIFNAPSATEGANVGQASSTLIADLYGRPVQAGDVFYLTEGGTTLRRIVTSVGQQIQPSTYGSDADNDNKQFAPSLLNPTETDQATFSNVSAPSGWNVFLNYTTIQSIAVSAGGSGYAGVPTVNISAPISIFGNTAWPATQAVAIAVLNGTTVGSVLLNEGGAGYYNGSVVGISGIWNGVSGGGSGYSSTNPPTIVVSSPPAGGTLAVITPVIPATGPQAGVITGYNILDPGTGYTSAPTLTVIGSPGSGAILYATINDFTRVHDLAVTVPGSGYTNSSVVSFSGGSPSVAATAIVVSLQLASATASAAGSGGYLPGDVLTLSGGTLAAGGVAATVTVLTVSGGGVATAALLNPGNYKTIPANAVATTGGHGAGDCTLTALWGLNTLAITNPGAGYSSVPTVSATVGSGATIVPDMPAPTTVSFTPTNGGTGATASAVINSYPTDWNGLVQGSIYNGQYGERYTIQVVQGNSGLQDDNSALVNIRSASGGFVANSVSVFHYGFDYIINSSALGGLVIGIRAATATTPLVLGQQFTFVVIGKYLPLVLAPTGEVLSISAVATGSGYANGTYNLVFATPPAGGTIAQATAVISGGSVTTITIIDPGNGYLVAPTIALPGSAGVPSTVAIFTCIISVPETSADLALVQSGIYSGPKNTEYIITVTKGDNLGATNGNSFTGATIQVKDTAGIDVIQNYTVAMGTQYALGTYGLKFLFPANLVYPSGLMSGTQATGSLAFNALSAFPADAINGAGSGYTVGDTIKTPIGAFGVTSTLMTVATIFGAGPTGAIKSVTITNPGLYVAGVPTVGLGAMIVSSNVGGGYSNGDVLTVILPVSITNHVTTAGTINIGNVDGSGNIIQANVTLAGSGAYTNAINGTVLCTTSGGSGTGATFLCNFGNITSNVSATGSGAIISLTWEVNKVVLGTGGTGYSVPPTVTQANGTGSPATFLPVLENGVIADVQVLTPGSGYNGYETIIIAAPVAYQGGLRTGDVYYVNAEASLANGPYSVIYFNGQVTDITGWTSQDIPLNLFNVDGRILYTGIISQFGNTPPTLAWVPGTAAQGGVLLNYDLSFFISSRTSNQWVLFQNSAYSYLFTTWRGLNPSSAGQSIILYTSLEQIVAAFGLQDPDNPICYGACIAFNGAQGKPIFVAKLPTNDLAGYTSVLMQAQRLDGAYALAPMTYDTTIQNLFQQHVDLCSASDVREWRRVYVATQNPGPFQVLATGSNGAPLQAVILSNGQGNLRLVCPAANFIIAGVLPGYIVRTQYATDVWGRQTYNSYAVQSVTAQDELLLVSGPNAPISPAINFQIWSPGLGTDQATYVGDISEAFDDRRVINVWVDSPQYTNTAGVTVTLPVYFVAAECAGLRSAALPQQGLTYTQLQWSVTNAPLMYTKYQQSDLDIAAENGTWIVTQEQSGGPVFIRHELTTSTNSGILYYEDMVGVNLDFMSYSVRNILQPYIGQRNVNLETLEEIATALRNLFNTFTNNPPGLTLIGPALIFWQNLTVAQDPVFADRINVQVTLGMPLPVNVITVQLLAVTGLVGTTITINPTLAQ